MNFNGLFDTGDASSPFAFAGSSVGGKPPPPGGLSLGLEMESAGGGGCGGFGVGGDVNRFIGVMGDGVVVSGDGADSSCRNGDENDSRSGSDNVDAGSGDDMDGSPEKGCNGGRKRKKKYHRHTAQQIQELEAAFKECPHPDEKQRLELSRRLSLESRQVKFWFQNRRTQLKTQIERHENMLLRQENDKLRAANMAIRKAMSNPMCSGCGGPAVPGEVLLEEQHLRVENARLKDELDRVSALASKFLGRPVAAAMSSLPLPLPLELGMGTDSFAVGSSMPTMPDFVPGLSGGLRLSPLNANLDMQSAVSDGSVHRTMLLELALAAMEELVKMAQIDEPLWIPSLGGGGGEMLNFDEYRRLPRVVGPKPYGFVSSASREVGAVVIINSLALMETLMDADRWADMFSSIVARASTTGIACSGVGGTINGALHIMTAQLQVLSPAVPVREVSFLRFCKQHADGLWAVVDVSVDGGGDTSCRVLPSGCLVQETPNGYSKVTWVVHSEYDEEPVHPTYRAALRSGIALGARRWIATLQRQCQCIAILMSSSTGAQDSSAITASGRRSMLKLAQRMTENFCAAVCAIGEHKWRRLEDWRGSGGGVEDGVRMLTRQSVEGAEPAGVVLSAATSVRLPGVAAERVFEYLRDERRRHEWDILSNGEPMQEMLHIAKGSEPGNAVSVLGANAANGSPASMLVLQETCTDASASMVVFAPVDVPAMHIVMNGGDSACVPLLPSGFAVIPDGHASIPGADASAASDVGGVGSLLTVAFQILVNTVPAASLSADSVKTASNLLATTIGKIKNVFRPADVVGVISP